MNKIRIAFIVTIPEMAYNFLWDHIVKLQEQYEVHLISNFSNQYIERRFKDIGVICHQLDIQRQINIIKDISSIFSLYLLYKNQKFTAIHSVAPKAGLVNVIAGFVAHIPIRIHIFTGQVWATKTGLKRAVLKFIDKLIVFFASDILVDGPSQRQFLIKQGIVTINNSHILGKGSICGVNLKRFSFDQQTRKVERNKIKASDKDIVYIFMGRLNHDKGIEELLQAFNLLVTKCPNAKLVFYGHDEENYMNTIKNYDNIILGENFFYPGRTEKPFESLQAGDVFVLPSWREGFGSSVIEASCLGLATITTDIYGLKDASIENVTGIRCKVNDYVDLYNCMKKYYDQPQMIQEHGRNGHKYIVENFDNKKITDAWVSFYNQKINRITL